MLRVGRSLVVWVVAVCAVSSLASSEWVRSFGGRGPETPFAVAVAPSGAVVVASSVGGGAGFRWHGGADRDEVRGASLFVLRATSGGDLEWVVGIRSTGVAEPRDVAVDAAGEAWVVGYFVGRLTAGGVTLESAGGADAFLLRLAADGTVVRGWSFGGAGAASAHSVSAGPDGRVVVAGSFEGEWRTPNGPALESDGSRDAFCLAIDSAGEVAWARRLGGTGREEALAVALGAAGEIAVAGVWDGAHPLSAEDRRGRGHGDVFLWRFAEAGAPESVIVVGGPGDDRAAGIAFDGDGGIVLAMTFQRWLEVPGTHLRPSAAGGHDSAIVRWTPHGDFDWVRVLGGDGTVYAYSIAAAGERLVVGGYYFQGGLDFGDPAAGGPKEVLLPPAMEGPDAFVVDLDLSGRWTGARRLGGPGVEQVLDVTVRQGLPSYAVGLFNRRLDGAAPVPGSRGKTDAFLASQDG